MKKTLFTLCFFYFIFVQSQEHAWVFFNDKPNEATYLANPLTMLTQRSLDRRTTQNIALDYVDVPISNSYINQIDAITGIEVKAKSKWLNAVHVLGSETDINNLEALSIVNHVEFAASDLNARSANVNNKKSKFDNLVSYNYGNSLNQTEQIGVDFLHENDFTGVGMQIAVLDAGFPNVDNFSVFQNIRDNNQILGGYNYVDRNTDFYQGNNHGTSVLSTMAGFIDNQLIGTAPDASYYLFITEDVATETPLEESLWVEAAEKADSLGVNIINTSLGYQDFDESKYDHLFSDIDGNTAFISRGANIAATRGILVVVSAGNDGNNPNFNHIATPADAQNVFTIGAVNQNDIIANFSSFGPTFDNRIKPDVLAKGVQTTIVNSSGVISTGNGTSFSSPVMAGAIASFWQAFPNKTNFEIMQMVRESAHLFANPTNQEGYGIPNFEQAYNVASINDFTFTTIDVYPNPVLNNLEINYTTTLDEISLKIFDLLGRKVLTKELNGATNIDFSKFESGVYILHFSNKFGDSKTIKVIKS